ncbi:MAG: aspartyl/glutamyl-tRNA amidotransferase subunit A [Spirochaetaceae bacterium]|jgi:aspartyl-tRNA(Asn)/glutamyl-tRNA(Gln) amidotransferase subunit A|nr:aspartyl/glutamyl-tRNA amidotransferase subunit A [Spirochaetaceae bacterium]
MNETYAQYFKAWEEKTGAFLEYRDDLLEKAAAVTNTPPSLAGLPFAVKDNIAVRDFSLSCASRFLETLRSPYTATAVRKLEEAGAFVVGKTNMDEFGMGSSTDLSALKTTNNPWDFKRVAGGSSGGSAAAVAAGQVPFALGSDTGGSVRQPAAFCGVVGLKPTWGAVSRYGLVAYASSLETIGILSDTVERCRAVFDVIKGADPFDQTSRDSPAAQVSSKIIGVLSPEAIAKALAAGTGGAAHKAAEAAALSPAVAHAFDNAKAALSALGYQLVPVEFPALHYAVPAYYTIAAAEASANLARFDGVRYGKRPDWAENPDDMIDKTRTAGFGPEVKLRILLGTFVLRSGFQDKYYHRAQQIRAAIRRDFERELGGRDADARCCAILAPVFPTTAFSRDGDGLSPFAQKAADIWTCCANLAGLPAVSFPVSVEDGLPTAVQLLGKPFAEGVLLDIAAACEKAHPFPHPKNWQNFWPQAA